MITFKLTDYSRLFQYPNAQRFRITMRHTRNMSMEILLMVCMALRLKPVGRLGSFFLKK